MALISKTLNTILNLKDKMTPTLVKVAKKTKGMSDAMKKVNTDTRKFVYKMRRNFQKLKKSAADMARRFAKIGIAAGAALTGAAAKIGFSEAMDIEGFRVQLETATKSAETAAKKMAYATKFANKTPFETKDIIEATARFEAMGINSEKWLPATADMAGATAKSIKQAYEAVIDALAGGEFERLKDLGIRKDNLVNLSETMFGKGQVFDNMGSLKDAEKLSKVLMHEMVNNYEGGAEKLSKTVEGLKSTIKGVGKMSLANIVGMGADGNPIEGSAYDKYKKVLEKIAGKLLELQESGAIIKFREKFTKAVNKVIKVLSKVRKYFLNVFNFIKNNKDVIFTIVSAFLGFKAVGSVVSIAAKSIGALRIAIGLLTQVSFSPLLVFQLIIGALAGTFYILYKNSETFRNKVNKLIGAIKGIAKSLLETIKNFNWDPIVEKISQLGDIFVKVALFTEKYVLPVIMLLWEKFKMVAKFVGSHLKDIFKTFQSEALNPIINLGKNIIKIFTGLLVASKPIINFLINIFGPAFIVAFKIVKANIITSIQVVSRVISSINRILSGLIEFITGVFSGDWEKAWNGLKEILGGIFDGIKALITVPIRNAFNIASELIDNFDERFKNIKETVKDVFSFLLDTAKDKLKSVGNFFVGIINGMIKKLNTINFSIPDWVPAVGGKSWGINIPKIPKFATGTQYAPGGYAKLHEFGGEIVNLPNGSQVIPADKSQKMVENHNKDFTLNITIEGNVYGEDYLIDKMGHKLYRKIKLALNNM